MDVEIAENRHTNSHSWLARFEGRQPPSADSAFINWTFLTLSMAIVAITQQ